MHRDTRFLAFKDVSNAEWDLNEGRSGALSVVIGNRGTHRFYYWEHGDNSKIFRELMINVLFLRTWGTARSFILGSKQNHFWEYGNMGAKNTSGGPLSVVRRRGGQQW